MQRAFIIRPFGKKQDSAGKEIDFEKVHNELIAPSLQASGLGGGTTGEIIDSGNVREDMFSLIIEADLVICDITVHNANVFYELGIRHALRKKRTILIKGAPVKDATPFDILTDRYLAYDVDDPAAAKQKLVDMIRASLAAVRETDSPIFKMLPGLPEVDPTTALVVPQDLTEEVGRASAARSHGWLRLLAVEVQGRRFQWPALRLIGKAQWAARDYDGAAETWAQVRSNDPDDIEANLALANLYERQYGRDKKPELLMVSNQAMTWAQVRSNDPDDIEANLELADLYERQYARDKAPELLMASNQAIARVLANQRTGDSRRAEALALQGRNIKTLWRLEFESLPNVVERRRWATSQNLLKSYQSYREAYLFDFNHFWSGLAALQMASVAKSLSGDPTWEDVFDNARDARHFADELEQRVEELRVSVGLSVQAAIDRLPVGEERMWAEISRADLMFLNEKERPRRVENAYIAAVLKDNLFACEAVTKQLALFASLGIRTDLAKQIIKALETNLKAPASEPDLHVVIFAGHRIDQAGCAEPRFPAESEQRARELIRDRLERLKSARARLTVLASAAPGSDILCHEACKDLGIGSTICLPMPVADFSRAAFGDLDDWRSRFLALIDGHAPLQLSDQEGLPRWLEGTGINPWERGNQWVLEMAWTKSKKVSLVALWDGKPTGTEKGGTAHMVEIARDAGIVDVSIISARELLAADTTKPVRAAEALKIDAISKLVGAEPARTMAVGEPLSNPAVAKRDSVFVSYSHKDERWLVMLTTMLAPLVRSEAITVWNDKKIRTGEHWKEEVESALSRATVAILLVSDNFLASKFIAEKELPPLLRNAQMGGLRIVWIPVSSCLYKETPIGEYQAAAPPDKPLDMLTKAQCKAALARICADIRQIG